MPAKSVIVEGEDPPEVLAPREADNASVVIYNTEGNVYVSDELATCTEAEGFWILESIVYEVELSGSEGFYAICEDGATAELRVFS